jgi:hypothetical protein
VEKGHNNHWPNLKKKVMKLAKQREMRAIAAPALFLY